MTLNTTEKKYCNILKLIRILEEVNTKFLEEHQDFILSGVSERSWYTPFSMYLNDKIIENKIYGYYVDTEYNRNNGKLKTIFDNNEFKTIPITCDIIVHSRGKKIYQDNLICIEMKKSEALNKDKLNDKKRLEILTKKSFDNIWSADGKTLPQYVCGYILGVYYEINLRKRVVHIEYYQNGEKIEEKNDIF